MSLNSLPMDILYLLLEATVVSSHHEVHTLRTLLSLAQTTPALYSIYKHREAHYLDQALRTTTGRSYSRAIELAEKQFSKNSEQQRLEVIRRALKDTYLVEQILEASQQFEKSPQAHELDEEIVDGWRYFICGYIQGYSYSTRSSAHFNTIEGTFFYPLIRSLVGNVRKCTERLTRDIVVVRGSVDEKPKSAIRAISTCIVNGEKDAGDFWEDCLFTGLKVTTRKLEGRLRGDFRGMVCRECTAGEREHL